MAVRSPVAPLEWLDPVASARLTKMLAAGIARARSEGQPTLVSICGRCGVADADPTAVVVASRRRGEPWFCVEQPDRDGHALAALGAVAAFEAAGPDRFSTLGRAWAAAAA